MSLRIGGWSCATNTTDSASGTSRLTPLTRAMQGLPVGTAYLSFTGVGAVGIGILASGDPARPAAIGLVVAGVVTLRAAET